MNALDFIAELIADKIIDDYDPEKYGFYAEVYETIQTLRPDIPEDGTSGFLAFGSSDVTRMKIKTGRFLRKKLKLNSGYLSESTVQWLTNAINTTLFPDIEVKLCKGGEITDNYDNEIGGNSCMTGSCSTYVKLYENNPDRYSQLVIKQLNNYARAMIVKLDNDELFMDRIYTDSDGLIEPMVAYANKNGWYVRQTSDPGNYSICKNNIGVIDYSMFIVSGLVFRDGEVPFADTLRSYVIENGRLNIFHTKVGLYGDGELDSTNGCLEDTQMCENCGDGVDEADALNQNDNVYCPDCFNELFTCCDYCNEYELTDEVYFVEQIEEDICEYCLQHHFTECEDCGEYFRDIDCSLTEVDNGAMLCNACLEDYQYCESCDTHRHEGVEFIKIRDTGENVCSDCADNSFTQCDCGAYFEDIKNCECLICKK